MHIQKGMSKLDLGFRISEDSESDRRNEIVNLRYFP